MARRANAPVDHAEVAPWNAPYVQVLRRAGRSCYWLMISEGEAHVLAAGLVNARVIVAATTLARTLEDAVHAAHTEPRRDDDVAPILVPRRARVRGRARRQAS